QHYMIINSAHFDLGGEPVHVLLHEVGFRRHAAGIVDNEDDVDRYGDEVGALRHLCTCLAVSVSVSVSVAVAVAVAVARIAIAIAVSVSAPITRITVPVARITIPVAVAISVAIPVTVPALALGRLVDIGGFHALGLARLRRELLLLT